MKNALAWIAMLVLNQQVLAQENRFSVQDHYNKAEYKVPMRDGVELHTVIYTPKSRAEDDGYPFLLVRTPYSSKPYGPNEYRSIEEMAPSTQFLEDGYIFVFQDVRGTNYSDGEWENLRPIRSDKKDPTATDESTDTYDTIEWLLKDERLRGWHNGRVGQWGISHPGWYTVMGMIDAHPALKAASPQATTFDAFFADDDHHNGAHTLLGSTFFRYVMSNYSGSNRKKLKGAFPWLDVFGTPSKYEFFLNAGPTNQFNEAHFQGRMTQVWQDLIDHPDYDDFWQRKNLGRSLNKITVPVLNVAGWFDEADPYGTIKTYQHIEERNESNLSTLVVGPWTHGGWLRGDGAKLGGMEFGSNPNKYFHETLLFPFFQCHLKDKGDWKPSEVTVFETGANRWRQFSHWPPRDVEYRNIYIRSGHELSFEPPQESGEDAFDSYISDPESPIPHTPPNARANNVSMVADQRYVSSRSDAVAYQTKPLEEDITVAGPILANLQVSTSGTDSDWFVKVIDVHPGEDAETAGAQMLVAIEVMRGKYRNSLSHPEPMLPGEATPISFNLWDKFHTFKKGHRIMVQIQSSWFPAFDRNPQTFTNIYEAKKADYQKATQKVYRSHELQSHLVLPILKPASDMTTSN